MSEELKNEVEVEEKELDAIVDDKSGEDVKTEEPKAADSIDGKINLDDQLKQTIIDAVKSVSNKQQAKPKSEKKFIFAPGRIGFFGFLALTVIVDGIVAVVRALANSRRK